MEGHLVNLDNSVRGFRSLFESRITQSRAENLSRINATMTSRASQSTANDILTRTKDCQNKNNSAIAKVNDLTTKVNTLQSEVANLKNLLAPKEIKQVYYKKPMSLLLTEQTIFSMTGSGRIQRPVEVWQDIYDSMHQIDYLRIIVDGRVVRALNNWNPTFALREHFLKGVRFDSSLKVVVKTKSRSGIKPMTDLQFRLYYSRQ